MLTESQREQLRAEFPQEAISEYPSAGGAKLTSVKAQYVTERLNDVFGIGGWRVDILEHKVLDGEVTVLISLEVGRVVEYQRNGEPFTKWVGIIPAIRAFGGATIRKGTLGDAFKSALTDAKSKAASQLEIANDIFKGLVRPGQQPRRQPSQGYQRPKQSDRFQVDSKAVSELRKAYQGTLTSAEVRRIVSEVTGGGSTWSSVNSERDWNEIRRRIEERLTKAA